ncbi:TRAP transporter substrate-binding protein [Thaumasiovibrio sp. DFM-14]|uniref:TRAP transporter substrate-binding protein n=1 Tax=Thaumasiovibrio sp. DFM-14 TaxID=3384792 RepID=UPI0039A2CF20
MKKSLPVLAAAFAMAMTSASAFAKSTHLTIANTTQADTPMSQTMIAFQERAQELSDGAITVQTSFGGALGNDTQLLQKAQIGSQVQAAQTSGANLGTVVDAFKAFDVPFLLNGPEQSIELLYQDGRLSGEIADQLQGFLGEKNLRLLYATPFEFRGILSNGKNVRTADDVKGMKFRVTPNPVERGIVESWGAAGTTMGISEVYTSLQTGIVDGLAIPPVTAQAFALNEVAKVFNNLNFQAHPTFVVINKRYWDRLSAEQQEILQQAADDAVMQTKQAHYDAIELAFAAFGENGAEVIQPTAEELNSFRRAAIEAAEPLATRGLNKDELAFIELIKTAAAE